MLMFRYGFLLPTAEVSMHNMSSTTVSHGHESVPLLFFAEADWFGLTNRYEFVVWPALSVHTATKVESKSAKDTAAR
jgi:hypothetical protein